MIRRTRRWFLTGVASIAALFISRKKASATAFTSVAGAHNWNAGASWTGGSGSNWPSSSGDTATILADAVLTIPTSVTIDCGAITYQDGSSGTTTIQVNGRLNLHGAVTMGTGGGPCALNMGAGGFIEANGSGVTWFDGRFTFAGTSGSHCTFQSTGSACVWTQGGSPFRCFDTWDYTDFSNCSGVMGRSQTSANVQHCKNCTFTNMGSWYFDIVGTNTDCGLTFENNDVRSVASSLAFQAYIGSNGQAVGVNPRTFKNNTFSGGANIGQLAFDNIVLSTNGFTNNIVDRFQFITVHAPAISKSGNFWSNTTGEDGAFFSSSSDAWSPSTTDYFYYEGNNHPFSIYINSIGTVQNNIHECPAVISGAAGDGTTFLGANWYVPESSATQTIKNNLFLGTGNAFGFGAGFANGGTYEFSNNTCYMNNDVSTSSVSSTPWDFSFGCVIESGATVNNGVSMFNNLFVDSNTNYGGVGDTETAFACDGAVGTQLNVADYNGMAGYNSGGSYVITTIGYYQNRNGTVIPGHGVHDVQADPRFKNKNAALATWDASLGGPGTAAHAIAELLKLNGTGGTWNSNYNVAALYNYVWNAFSPTNQAYKSAGRVGGVDIGAVPVSPVPTVTGGIVQ